MRTPTLVAAALTTLAALTSTAHAQEARWTSNLGAHLATASPRRPNRIDPATYPAEGADPVGHAEAYWSELIRLELAIIDAADACAQTPLPSCDDAVAPHLGARTVLLARAVPVWRALSSSPDPSPDREQARLYLAHALLVTGADAEGAALLRDLSRMGAASSYAPFASARLADYLYRRHAFSLAMPLYLAAATNSPGARAYALYMVGWSHASLGDLPQAMRSFIDAIHTLDARPHQIARARLLDDALDALALAYAEAGVPLETHTFFAQFVGDAHTWDGTLRVARQLARLDRVADADAVARVVISGAPPDHPARAHARELRATLRQEQP
jgi:tetratricopeptide (TPR) repeat protein